MLLLLTVLTGAFRSSQSAKPTTDLIGMLHRNENQLLTGYDSSSSANLPPLPSSSTRSDFFTAPEPTNGLGKKFRTAETNEPDPELEPGTCLNFITKQYKLKNTKCGVNSLCCVGSTREVPQLHRMEPEPEPDTMCDTEHKFSAEEAVALLKSAEPDDFIELTAESIQSCCHTTADGDTRPHFNTFGQPHRDCVTGELLPPILPAAPHGLGRGARGGKGRGRDR